ALLHPRRPGHALPLRMGPARRGRGQRQPPLEGALPQRRLRPAPRGDLLRRLDRHGVPAHQVAAAAGPEKGPRNPQPLRGPRPPGWEGPLPHRRLALARAVIYFAVWNGMAYLLNRWSRQQDQKKDPAIASRCEVLSAPGIILYVVTITFASIDWLMSLEPE